jgi:hypothetical protein
MREVTEYLSSCILEGAVNLSIGFGAKKIEEVLRENEKKDRSTFF